MLIDYKKANILTVPLKGFKAFTGSPKKGLPKDIIRVVPGIQDIPDEAWDRMKDDESIKNHVTAGNITFPKAAAKKSGGAAIPDLSKVSVKDAMEVIEGVMEAETVKAMIKAEKKGGKREAMINALEARLAKINEVDESAE
jgi:hypothetical protein